MQQSRQKFDFDAWRQLAENSPADFERRRRAAVEQVINGRGVNVSRMRALQCRIDLEIRRAKTPLKACLRLSGLMWDSFERLQSAFHQGLVLKAVNRECPPLPKARILVFPTRK
jgi:hypothetical protein